MGLGQLKAICRNGQVVKKGDWYLPAPKQIGYLDQHYATLDPEQTVCDLLSNIRLDWSHREIREHLNDFLFRKNEEVDRLVKNLSGGEKARLSLSLIAARTPQLLILDEITNNIDLETKQHLIQVLRDYPGAMIVVSHEESFLNQIGVNTLYFLRG